MTLDTSQSFSQCEHFNQGRCQSCSLLNLSYDESLQNKAQDVSKILKDVIPSEVWQPPVGATKPLGVRQKSKWAINQKTTHLQSNWGFANKEGEVTFDLLECPQHHSDLKLVSQTLKTLTEQYKIAGYDIQKKSGELKFVTLIQGHNTKEILIRITLRSRESIDRLPKLVKDLRERNPQVRSVSATIQPIHAAMREGDQEYFFTEEKTVRETVNDFTLFYGAKSFIQVNPLIKQSLYQTAANWAQNANEQGPPKSALDLFCGNGGFAFHLAKFIPSVYGIEISAESIHLATLAKEANHHLIPKNHQVEFIQSNAQLLESDQLQQILKKIDLLLVNPPRAGLGQELLDKIKKHRPTTIIYSSCNPETLQENLYQLLPYYKIKQAQMFDMFTFTKHAEVLVFLQRLPH